MKVLVTGALGFLGRYMLTWLAKNRPDVERLGLVRSTPCDLDPAVAVTEIPEGTDVIIHLAGSRGIGPSFDEPRLCFEQETLFAMEVFETARRLQVKTVLLASSCAIYGPGDDAARETQELKPLSPYGVAKIASESYGSYLFRKHRQDIRVARIANPYGPGQKKLVIFDLIQRALKEGELTVHSSGHELRDFIHAEDTVRALWTIVESGAEGTIYNVGSGQPETVSQLAHWIALESGLDPSKVKFTVAQRPEGPIHGYPDTSRLSELGFRPAIDLANGIKQTVNWVRTLQ